LEEEEEEEGIWEMEEMNDVDEQYKEQGEAKSLGGGGAMLTTNNPTVHEDLTNWSCSKFKSDFNILI
jgi:hypothetical protein